MTKPNWLVELESYVDGIAYGDVQFAVKRVNRKTVQVVTTSNESLRYVDNGEALKDIVAFLAGLIDDGHTGEVQFKVAIQNGQITLLAIQNSREQNYQNEKRQPKREV